jgi:hypothetical protein
VVSDPDHRKCLALCNQPAPGRRTPQISEFHPTTGRQTTRRKKVMSEENDQIIELISNHVKTLLQNHWPDISDFRNGEESIKIGFSHDVSYQGQERVIESTISFGKRIKDSTVDRIDTEQMNMEFNPSGAKRSRKKKTNILETTILESGPETAA